MNIKYLKALKEAKIEDIIDDPNTPWDETGQCAPFYSYPIPNVSDLCELISNYSKIKIEAEMTDMGMIGYSVTVWITAQDTVEKTFSSPFLDDALAEALLALKKNNDEKQRMMDTMEHPLE